MLTMCRSTFVVTVGECAGMLYYCSILVCDYCVEVHLLRFLEDYLSSDIVMYSLTALSVRLDA